MVMNGDYIVAGATDDILRSSLIGVCEDSLCAKGKGRESIIRRGWIELIYSATFAHYLAYGLSFVVILHVVPFQERR